MKYLLDTDACIYLMKHPVPAARKKIERLQPGDLGISSVTLAELQYGVEKSQQAQRNQEALDEFLVPLEVAPLDDEAAAQYGYLRAELERKGTPIGSNDLFIAAHALALAVPLVTNNTREFSRVRGLKLENWFKG